MAYELDVKQNAAADTKDGQVLVIACPGSGKTTVIIERVHRLINKGVRPGKMLVITFTKAAADEMRRRYEEKHGKSEILFGTIHSVCYRIIQREYKFSRENILKESEQWDFFRRYLFKRVDKTDLEEYIRQLLTEISFVRNRQMDPHRYDPDVCSSDMFVQILSAYSDYKLEQNKIDFDDMLIICRKTLIRNPEALAFWKKQFEYIMIDEFQDTNKIQADIFYMLAGKYGNLFVVGDDDQSIYGFRSADSSIMLDFRKWYPDCKEIYMDTNYRSSQKIVNSAAQLIEHNHVRFQKDIKPNRKDTGNVFLCAFDSSLQQAVMVIEHIANIHKNGTAYEEIAVLYRTNSQSQILISLLVSMKDPFPFYSTEPPKDIHNEFIFGDLMAYWRLAEGNWKQGDLQRILNRPGRYLKAEAFKKCSWNLNEMLACCNNLSNPSAAKDRIFDLYSDVQQLKGKKPTDFIKCVMKLMRYEDWLSSYADFTGKDLDSLHGILEIIQDEAARFETMQDWYDYSIYYANKLQEMRRNKNRNGVCFSTFHSAKGLEWSTVIIIDCNEDICPFKKAEKPEEFEEERRLFYVGVTRAKNELLLFYNKENHDRSLQPSRYLHELGFMGYDPTTTKHN